MVSKLKQPIEFILQSIANILLKNTSLTNNPGLLKGKMGISIFFYHYGRYTENEVYTKYAGALIDDVYDILPTQTSVDFANGLTGIGWGIEYLVKNKFVEADSDEILEEMDQILYNLPIDIWSKDDLFGIGHYSLSRISEHENYDNNLNMLVKKQQLLFLIDECKRLLIHKRFLDYNIPTLKLSVLNPIIYFFIEIHKLGIFHSNIDRLFHYISSYIEFSLHQENDWSEKVTLSKLIKQIQFNTTNPDLLRKFSTIATKIALEYPDSLQLGRCFAKSAWHLLVYKPHNPCNEYWYNLTEKVLSIIGNEEDVNQRLDKLYKNNFGLTGIAGIGWGLLNFLENVSIKNKRILI